MFTYHKFYQNNERYYIVIKDNTLVWYCRTKINTSSLEEITDSNALTIGTIINNNSEGMGLFIHIYEDCMTINKKIFNSDFETVKIYKNSVTYDKHCTSETPLINNTYLQTSYLELLR